MNTVNRTILTVAATYAVIAVVTHGWWWSIQVFLVFAGVIGAIAAWSWLYENLAGWPSYLLGCVIRSIPGYKRREARRSAEGDRRVQEILEMYQGKP